MSHDDCDGEPGAKSPQRLAARLPPPTRRSVYVPPRTARVPREQAPPTQTAARGPRRGLTDSPKTRFARHHAARCRVEAAQSTRCSTESCPGVGAEPEARRLARGDSLERSGQPEAEKNTKPPARRQGLLGANPDTLLLSDSELGPAALLARPPGLGVTPQAAELPDRLGCARAGAFAGRTACVHDRHIHTHVRQPHTQPLSVRCCRTCVCMRPSCSRTICACVCGCRETTKAVHVRSDRCWSALGD